MCLWVKGTLVTQTVKNLIPVQETQVWSLGWEDPLEKGMVTTLVFLPGEFHEQGSLAGYRPWGCKKSDMNERLSLWVKWGSDYSGWGSLGCKTIGWVQVCSTGFASSLDQRVNGTLRKAQERNASVQAYFRLFWVSQVPTPHWSSKSDTQAQLQ